MQTTPNDDDEQVEYERWFAARGRTNNKLLPDSANDMEWLEEIERLRKSGPLPSQCFRSRLLRFMKLVDVSPTHYFGSTLRARRSGIACATHCVPLL
jgi:hypothetical protein